MKKILSVLFAVVITLTVFTACSANDVYVGNWEATISQSIDVGLSNSVEAVAVFSLEIKDDETLVLQMSNNDQEVFDKIVESLPTAKQEEMANLELTEEEFDAMFLEENGVSYDEYVAEYTSILQEQLEANAANLDPINGTWTVEDVTISVFLENSELFGIPQGEPLNLSLVEGVLKSGDGVDFYKK